MLVRSSIVLASSFYFAAACLPHFSLLCRSGTNASQPEPDEHKCPFNRDADWIDARTEISDAAVSTRMSAFFTIEHFQLAIFLAVLSLNKSRMKEQNLAREDAAAH